VAGLLVAGLTHHQAGRLSEAEIHYRRLLDVVPDHADVLHLYGGLAYQTGRHQAAIELIGRAIEHNGGDPPYHSSYGLVLQGLHRFDEAVATMTASKVKIRPPNGCGDIVSCRVRPSGRCISSRCGSISEVNSARRCFFGRTKIGVFGKPA
jgi:Flp pilus assembly protein TadD